MSSSAKFTSGSIQEIARRIADKKVEEIKRKTGAIKNMGTQFIQASYESDFTKSPIDTGLSQRLSGLDTVNFNGLLITLGLKIGTDYALYFRRGLGSSRRYGNRDPLQMAKDRIINGFLNYIK